MDPRKLMIGIIIIFVAIVGLRSVLFCVDETEQVIITQLGKYVKTIKQPGLHTKLPLIQTVHRLEKRILEYDAAAAKIITKDKKHLVIDNYARWQIVDPLKFYQTVRDEFGAQSRLDDIVFAELREELALHNLSEIITTQREEIMEKVGADCDKKAGDYGIEIFDVRIKRADLPREVENSVYARMRAERERIAKRYRSEGEERAVEIRAEAGKERTILLAEAYRKAQKIRGEGEAEAVRIYAEAFQQNPEFYEFLRTLDAYKKSLKEKTTIIFPSDSELFKYLK